MKKNSYLLVFLSLVVFSCNTTSTDQQNMLLDDNSNDKFVMKHEPFDYEELRLFGPQPEKKQIRAYKEEMQKAKGLFNQKTDLFGGDWTNQGPGNIGGRVNALLSHPENSDEIYAGFARGGLWKTLDGGNNWIPLWDDMPTQAVSALAYDPTNTNIIYAGSGDVNISGNVYLGDGLYKSENGGSSWQKIGLEEVAVIGDILVHPQNPQLLTVATMGNPFLKDGNRGIYQSSDGGQNWTQTLFINDSTGVHDLAWHPDNPDVMLAGAWTRHRTGKVSRISGAESKAFISTDGGAKWTMLSLDVPEITGRTAVSFSKKDPETAYAMFIGSDSYFHSLHRTTDGGENWELMVGADENTPTMMGGFAWFFGRIEALTIPGTDIEQVYLCGVDLWAYDKMLQEWTRQTPPWWEYSVHADKHAIITDVNGHILLGTDGGVYRLNEFQTWSDIENIPNNMFYRVAYNPHLPNNYYGGMQDNGSSGGNELIFNDWPRIFGGDGFQMAFHPDNPEEFYAETQNGNIVYTDDGGYNFFGVSLDSFWNDRKNWDMQYIISPHDPSVLYTGTSRALAITNDGGYFTPFALSGDLTDEKEYINSYHTITALDESSLEEGLLYYGTADGNIWRAENFEFEQLSDLPKYYVTSIKASPNKVDAVYTTLSNYKFNDNSPRLFRSTDRGENWQAISNGLPSGAVNDIVIYPQYNDSILFCATNVGVFASINAGEMWHRLGSSLPMIPVNDLVINEENNLLVAGTYGRSINTYPIDSLTKTFEGNTTASTTNSSLRFEIYPNPASEYLNVYSERKGIVTIYNSEGRKIMEKGIQNNNRIEVNSLKRGVYFVELKSGNNKGIKKIIIH